MLLEGLKLNVQYFGHLMWRTDSSEIPWCWERLKMGGEGDDRGWDGWMASPTQWTWVWVRSRSWWWTEKPGLLQVMGLQSRTWLSDWTELSMLLVSLPTCSPCQQPLIKAFSFLPYEGSSLPCLPLFSATCEWWWLDPFLYQAMNKYLLLGLIWVIFIYFHTPMRNHL